VTPHAYGCDSLLLLLDEGEEVGPWLRALEDAGLPQVLDVVAGARSVVLVAEPGSRAASRLAEAVRALAPREAADERTGRQVEIPVRYDGEDLDEVARRTGLTPDEVVALHAASHYEVSFCGFSPGFAYLRGLPDALVLPRRDVPRPRVPAGSVAVAERYSAVYPQDSPGGWWLLGRTELVMFDAQRDPPALLRPGDRVRFVAS
jgi:KipI family sensor histidine kinase inhibitor